MESEIQINPLYIDGLSGLNDYSHVLVFFYMDGYKDTNEGWKRKPRGLVDLAEIGCFAQRTKYRPNRIGLSTVKIVSIEGDLIKVRGLDANDGTIVLDIKPYIYEFDVRVDVKVPNWMNELMQDYF
ncbi:SAM-dependent methyltransferase [Fredinandcohnia humi]